MLPVEVNLHEMEWSRVRTDDELAAVPIRYAEGALSGPPAFRIAVEHETEHVLTLPPEHLREWLTEQQRRSDAAKGGAQ